MAVNSRELVVKVLVQFFLLNYSHYPCSADVIVSTNSGAIKGVSERVLGVAVFRFLGIPYGKIPRGNLSYKHAVTTDASIDRFGVLCPNSVVVVDLSSPESWGKVKDTVQRKSSCLHTSRGADWFADVLSDDRPADSEDCLYLNVFTPSLPGREISLSNIERKMYGDAPFPVLVMFQSDVRLQTVSPLRLVAGQKVVVVTASYRQGPLGYLCLGEAANAALADQQQVLRWVNKNINKFNGDQHRVTLLGQGMAAVDASLHLVMSESADLFQRLWVTSGSFYQLSAMSHMPAKLTQRYANSLGCLSDNTSTTLECLRSRSTSEPTETVWRPCADGKILLKNPITLLREKILSTKIDVVLGFNQYDQYSSMSFSHSWENATEQLKKKFSLPMLTKLEQKAVIKEWLQLYRDGSDERMERITPEEAYSEVLTDAFIVTPLVRLADQLSLTAENTVYMYEYSHHLSLTPSRSYAVQSSHGEDMLSLLGVPCDEFVGWSKSDCAMSEVMMAHLGNFARTGEPNSPFTTVHLWPKYHLCDKRKLLNCRRQIFSLRTADYSAVMKDYKSEKFEFWTSILYGNASLSAITPSESTNSQTGPEITTTFTSSTTAATTTTTTKPSSENVSVQHGGKDEL